LILFVFKVLSYLNLPLISAIEGTKFTAFPVTTNVGFLFNKNSTAFNY